MPLNGADVNFEHRTRAKFNSLITKNDNTFYVVLETDGSRVLYLGNVQIGENSGGGNEWTYLGSRTSNGNITISNMNNYNEIRIDVIPDLHAETVNSNEYYLGDSKIIPSTLLTEKNTLPGLPSKSRTSGVSLNIKDSLGTKQVTIYGSYTTNNAYVVTGLPSAYQFELFVYGR